MKNYRKKPVVIQAVQWTGENRQELVAFMGCVVFANGKPEIDTLEGKHTASIGDWIIKGVKGEFYPCKPEIFDLTYESPDSSSPDQIKAQLVQLANAAAIVVGNLKPYYVDTHLALLKAELERTKALIGGK